MAEGPLGFPRVLTSLKVYVSKDPVDVSISAEGPMGFSRPFVSAEGSVTEEDVQECMESRAAHDFARGMEKSPYLDDEGVKDATESWCRGILQATSEPTNNPAEMLPPEFVPTEAEIIDIEGETVDGSGGLPDTT